MPTEIQGHCPCPGSFRSLFSHSLFLLPPLTQHALRLIRAGVRPALSFLCCVPLNGCTTLFIQPPVEGCVGLIFKRTYVQRPSCHEWQDVSLSFQASPQSLRAPKAVGFTSLSVGFQGLLPARGDLPNLRPWAIPGLTLPLSPYLHRPPGPWMSGAG